MGYDDGECEIALDGRHVFALAELVTTERGQLNQVHRCVGCGVEVLDVVDQDAARPPL